MHPQYKLCLARPFDCLRIRGSPTLFCHCSLQLPAVDDFSELRELYPHLSLLLRFRLAIPQHHSLLYRWRTAEVAVECRFLVAVVFLAELMVSIAAWRR